MAINFLGTTVAGDRRGAESFVKLDDTDKAVAFMVCPLGGSRHVSITGAAYIEAIDYIDFTMPDAASTGGVWKALVDLKCENAATTITPKIRNITDSTDAVVGSAHASTSWGSQTLSFTPASGKTYRLMFVKSDDVFQCFGIGRLQRTAA
jgi:hypothetical protein